MMPKGAVKHGLCFIRMEGRKVLGSKEKEGLDLWDSNQNCNLLSGMTTDYSAPLLPSSLSYMETTSRV